MNEIDQKDKYQRRIYKYELQFERDFTIPIYALHKVIHLEMLHGKPTLWAEVHLGSTFIDKQMYCVWTGEDLPKDFNHLWTVKVETDMGYLIYHFGDHRIYNSLSKIDHYWLDMSLFKDPNL